MRILVAEILPNEAASHSSIPLFSKSGSIPCTVSSLEPLPDCAKDVPSMRLRNKFRIGNPSASLKSVHRQKFHCISDIAGGHYPYASGHELNHLDHDAG